LSRLTNQVPHVPPSLLGLEQTVETVTVTDTVTVTETVTFTHTGYYTTTKEPLERTEKQNRD